MTRFNLSEWGLNHRSFVLFLMLAPKLWPGLSRIS